MGLYALMEQYAAGVLQAGPVEGAYTAFTYGSDADATATAVPFVLHVTGAVISATRKYILPLVAGAVVIVHNGEAHSVTLVGATGSGVTVATTKVAVCYCDGTNWVRVTADT